MAVVSDLKDFDSIPWPRWHSTLYVYNQDILEDKIKSAGQQASQDQQFAFQAAVGCFVIFILKEYILLKCAYRGL